MKAAFNLLTLCILAISQSSRAADDQDIRQLLNEANSALETPAAKPKDPATHATHRRKAADETLDSESSEEAEPKPAAPLPITEARLVPLNSPDINEILSLDVAAKKRELTNTYPRSVVRLSGGFNWLGNGYGLVQDDDTFRQIDGGALTGLYFQYNPSWLLPFLNTSVTSLSLTLDFGTGYFRGQGLMRRTGVQTGDQTHDLNAIPIDVDLGPVLSLWRKIGIQFTYGAGAEFVHQTGEGQWDTVTNMFWADAIAVAIRGYISDTIELSIGWKYRGVLMGSTPTVSGSMLTAGFGFEFAD